MATNRSGKKEFKIGVKHFLNKRLKGKEAIVDAETSETRYPLYIQITAKGQSIKVKSAIGRYMTDEDFEKYLHTNEQDLMNEAIVIRRYILRQKPFEDSEFVLKWSWTLNYEDYELNSVISLALHDLVEYAISSSTADNMIRYERFWRRARTNNLPCKVLTDEEYDEATNRYFNNEHTDYKYASFYGKIGMFFVNTEESNYYSMYMSFLIPQVKILSDMFPPEFWDFSNYYDKMYLDRKADFLIIDDIVTGRFDNLFMATWHDESALKAIRAGFDTLCSETPEIKDRMEQIRLQYVR